TDWEEFRSLDLGRVGSYMRTPIVVDGRNLFEPAQMQAAGLEYYSLGRGEATFHGAETGARMSVRRRSSVTVTPGQNSQVPVEGASWRSRRQPACPRLMRRSLGGSPGTFSARARRPASRRSSGRTCGANSSSPARRSSTFAA